MPHLYRPALAPRIPAAQQAFQDKLKAEGYEISKFKVTDGNCYEIYGFDKDKRKVEIYHDPVTGKAVKTEIKG